MKVEDQTALFNINLLFMEIRQQGGLFQQKKEASMHLLNVSE
jgi:hypothetical protein